MLSTLASNAILSKARAMYGKRLTEKEYKDLLHCKTVGEIAAYLKQRTAYGPILTGVNEKEVHRGQLEALLRKKLFYDFAALCRYEITVGEHFADYLLARSEIDQILHSLMLLMGGRSSDYLFSMPLFLDAHTHINLTALSQTKSYDDFLSALSGTPYQSLLSPFRPEPGKPLDMAAIENALSGFLYNRVFETVRKHSRGKAREELLYLFQTYIDFSNYARIIRMKKYYSMEPGRHPLPAAASRQPDAAPARRHALRQNGRRGQGGHARHLARQADAEARIPGDRRGSPARPPHEQQASHPFFGSSSRRHARLHLLGGKRAVQYYKHHRGHSLSAPGGGDCRHAHLFQKRKGVMRLWLF